MNNCDLIKLATKSDDPLVKELGSRLESALDAIEAIFNESLEEVVVIH